MSFTGFGSTNNNNSTSGGFGSGGFGSGSTGFGVNNNNTTANSGSLFGGGATSTNTSAGFGGFGSNNTSSPFGAKPVGGFGTATSTTSGGMFGGNTSTSGGFGAGGFGNTNNTSSGFGGGSTSGSIFGASKPATGGFGTSNSGGSIFGSGNTSSGFGSNTNAASSNPFASNSASTGGFGAASNSNSASGGFGGFGQSNAAAATNNGTAGTPFQAFTEKDTASNQTSHYQSIAFQQPYLNQSFEELRTQDYLQGRRYGNSNGQAGSFGASTGFGGGVFGGANNSSTTGGGLFGGASNNTGSGSTFGTGFGATNNANTTTGGFGSNTSTAGGLFGNQNKPAGGGIFGGGQSSGSTTGGFGATTGGGAGGFGSTNNQASTGGLFGNTQQQQNKPAFGGLGSTNTNTGGFGSTTNTGGGLFGGNLAQNANTGGGLFGTNNAQQQPNNSFGANANTGSSLFGNNQNKPATGGLFGSGSNTGSAGGLFGANNNQQQQQSGGLFGSNTNNNQGGGLFGNNNQSKPASTGLFGSGAANTNTTGGLFGGNNQQAAGGSLFGGNNNAGSSLFGGNSQNKPAGSSLFGNSTNATGTGGGLFGGLSQNSQQNQQNSTTGGLFGSMGQSTQNQQNNSSLFGSALGGSQTPQQNQLHASLTLSPYGNDQLFSSLGHTSTPVGPLATPLTGAKPAQSKTPSLLSSTRLNSPIYTPRASTLTRNGTYGFSYSTYGTPGSAYSASLTPQQSSLLKPTGSLGSALTSRLAKSMSMNNLRGDSTPREGESLLRPTPGSASSKYLQSGNMRKLIIDRGLRADLFAPPEQQKQLEGPKGSAELDSTGLSKKVSFDNSAVKSTAEPGPSNALVRTEESEETKEDQNSPGLFRARPVSHPQLNGSPEMHQVNGSSLKTVPEDSEPLRTSSAPATKKPAEKKIVKGVEIGDYWTKPAMKDLKNMSRTQLSKLGKFVVGRDGVGRVEFGPCDLTGTNLDDICGKICVFSLRAVTVYPEEAAKPAMGKGLNVPSTIYLENSWPRSHGGRRAVLSKSGPAFDKHLARLKSTTGTTFRDYDVETGVWSFTVEHFTTYGLDDEDDEYTEDMDLQHDSSGLSELQDDTMHSVGTGTGEMDDTFEFKNLKTRSQSSLPGKQVPGGFEEQGVTYDFDDPSADEGIDEHSISGGLGTCEEDDPFTSPGGAVQAPSPDAVERYHSSMVLDDDPSEVDYAEETQADSELPLPGSFDSEEAPKGLRSILKPTAGLSVFASPEKLVEDPWEEQLQRTISPKKRDRQALKDLQQSILRDQGDATIENPLKRSMLEKSTLGRSVLNQSYLAQKSAKKVGFGVSTLGHEKADVDKSQAFRTSMDIMNSLWAQEKTSKKAPSLARRFETPYPKKPRLSASSELNESDAAFHDSMKPSFTNDGTFICSVSGSVPQVTELLSPALQPLVSEHKEVRFSKWSTPVNINTDTLTAQKESTAIDLVDGFPMAITDVPVTVFLSIASRVEAGAVPERAAWEVADILFDTVSAACAPLIEGMSIEEIHKNESRLRMDTFTTMWAEMLQPAVEDQLQYAQTAEEKALLHLTRNDIHAACETLTAAKDFKLATMIAQLPGSGASREIMKKQIITWCERNDWSEMPDAVRALYSIIAGEVCTVQGRTGVPENRVSAFCVSEHFGLSWTQSFGLRVFFGGHRNLDSAIEAYVKDLDDGTEKVQPKPWWAENSEAAEGVEETLLGLLRLKISRATVDELFDPKSVSGSAVNSRLAWQLATFLRAKGHARDLSEEKLDQLTLGFATELEAANVFVTAAWVLLHLKDAAARRKAITGLLFRTARYIEDPKAPENMEDGNWEHLTGVLQIPEQILWAAKAQYARAELQDAILQTKYLLQAQATDEAHEVLCNTIGPRAVIEEDYDVLSDVLSAFEGHRVDGWEHGGQVYSDFAALVTLPSSRKHKSEGRQVMERLALGLQAMESGAVHMALEGRVAVVEMDRVLQEEMRDFNAQGGSVEVRDVRSGGLEGVEGGADSGRGFDAFARYQVALGVVA